MKSPRAMWDFSRRIRRIIIIARATTKRMYPTLDKFLPVFEVVERPTRDPPAIKSATAARIETRMIMMARLNLESSLKFDLILFQYVRSQA